jgi:hypothetical protein
VFADQPACFIKQAGAAGMGALVDSKIIGQS